MSNQLGKHGFGWYTTLLEHVFLRRTAWFESNFTSQMKLNKLHSLLLGHNHVLFSTYLNWNLPMVSVLTQIVQNGQYCTHTSSCYTWYKCFLIASPSVTEPHMEPLSLMQWASEKDWNPTETLDRVSSSGGSRIPQRRRQPQREEAPTYYSVKFSHKLHYNETMMKIRPTRRGGGASKILLCRFANG